MRIRKATTSTCPFHALRDGEIEFGEFERRTRALWRRQASVLMRRWRQPAWVSREDVEQDLLLACLDFVWKWEPNRGTALDRYVVWNAFDKAKKRAHKHRGAKLSGDADSNPSRFDRPLSAYSNAHAGEYEDIWWESRLATQPEQEEHVADSERAEHVEEACQSETELRVVRMLRDGADLADVVNVLCGERASVEEAIDAAVGAASAVAMRMSA